MKTMDKNKIYWFLNWIMVAVVFAVLLGVFLYRYFAVGTPVEANWTEEVLKYLFMWPILSVVVGVICYVPFRMLAGYITHSEEK